MNNFVNQYKCLNASGAIENKSVCVSYLITIHDENKDVKFCLEFLSTKMKFKQHLVVIMKFKETLLVTKSAELTFFLVLFFDGIKIVLIRIFTFSF